MMKRFFVFILISLFIASISGVAYAAIYLEDSLCEQGLKFYDQGRYEEALDEFQKALIVRPGYQPALKYIQMVQQAIGEGFEPETKEEALPVVYAPVTDTPQEAVQETLDMIDLQKQMIRERQVSMPARQKEASLAAPKVVPVNEVPVSKLVTKSLKKGQLPVTIINLDNDTLNSISQPIEIPEGKSIIVSGRNIKRFLVTTPEILGIERTNADQITVSGKNIGYSYLHIWDDNGRWTLECLGVFPAFEIPTYAEELRMEEGRSKNFKFRYSLDWADFDSGRGWGDLRRQSYSWAHFLTLTGETPFGDFDSSVSVRSLNTSTDLTYATVGLTNGKLGPFKGFNLRGLDFYPTFTNLTFPGATLRGGILSSPAFNNKLNYTLFWGKEGGGAYGNLSPGLDSAKDEFLDGVNLSFSPDKAQNYKFTIVTGYGKDRDNTLYKYGYDASANWNFNKWGAGYEIANDSKTVAQLLNAHFNLPKLNLNAELRDVDKKYMSMTGPGYGQGELGGLFNLNYAPTEKLTITGLLNIFRDRMFPAEDNPDRWNEDFSTTAAYQFTPTLSGSLFYSINNDLGRISQSRYQSPGASLNKNFTIFNRDLSMYVNYYHQESDNFSSHESDYINDKVYFGARYNLIGQLYYYINREYNWLNAVFTNERTHPNALETGFDWTDRILSSPFFGNFRFTYRQEKDTESNLSFLSGENYIEAYTEVAYRPNDTTEIYGSCRGRDVWAGGNPNVNKRVEMEYNAGLRYLWDTGVRWESSCDIEGYVFQDLNSDGLRQRNERPMQNIRIWLGKNKSQMTDIFGYYRFKSVRGNKATIILDTATLPPGYVLTVPMSQQTPIQGGRVARIDFGIVSRSEITGYVFEDKDNNGRYDREDKGVQGAVITLDGSKQVVTDSSGRYSFSNSATGGHTLTLDIDSLPVYYLPKVSVTKKISLFEGVTYTYNIPLKRIKEEE